MRKNILLTRQSIFNFGQRPTIAGQGKYKGLIMTADPQTKDEIEIYSKRKSITFKFAAYTSPRGKLTVKNISSQLYLTDWTANEERFMRQWANQYFRKKFQE